MSEVEELIALDLISNEYKGAKPDEAIFLAQSAARRIVGMLANQGYVIRKEQIPSRVPSGVE
jgi:hypothetical protein